MEDIRNENLNENAEIAAEETIEEITGVEQNVEDTTNTEEASEVVLVDEAEQGVTYHASQEENAFEYTESEMSGLTDEQRRRQAIFDKITTGILIALMASPALIVIYILLWFVFKP